MSIVFISVGRWASQAVGRFDALVGGYRLLAYKAREKSEQKVMGWRKGCCAVWLLLSFARGFPASSYSHQNRDRIYIVCAVFLFFDRVAYCHMFMNFCLTSRLLLVRVGRWRRRGTVRGDGIGLVDVGSLIEEEGTYGGDGGRAAWGGLG